MSDPDDPTRNTPVNSVHVPPRGTRGAPVPRFLLRFGNTIMAGRFRGKGGARTQGGVPALLLETTGAKTGEKRQALLGYLEESEGSWLVIASAVGAARHPGWFHNLAKKPEATIEFGDGRRVAVRAETPSGEDLTQAWERIARDAPEYIKYQSKTDRTIPVVRLRAASY